MRRFKNEAEVTLLLRSRSELDLLDQRAVDAFYEAEKPDVAIIAAAKVGGIHANKTYPADFLFDNLTIATNTTRISPVMQKCLVTGLLGSLTTFSTFAFESLNLIQDGRYGAAMMKISISLVVGLLLVWVGMLTAGAFVSSET